MAHNKEFYCISVATHSSVNEILQCKCGLILIVGRVLQTFTIFPMLLNLLDVRVSIITNREKFKSYVSNQCCHEFVENSNVCAV